MDIKDSTILVMGGAGLVGLAVARLMLEHEPNRLVLASLTRREAEGAVAELTAEGRVGRTKVEAAYGDLFVPDAFREERRAAVMDDAEMRRSLVDDLYGELTDEVFQRSSLGRLLLDVAPTVIVDCINTAGVLAYQNAFASAAELRAKASEGGADSEAVERHLSTLYMPQLIRHTQIALEGMRRAGTRMFVKVGTAGTGGMGLNIPFTHSEERPSRVLLAKASLAGAQTLLLYLMARTPGAPAVKEVKPTAAISWKSIGFGPIKRGSRPLLRSDATEATSISAAFGAASEEAYLTLEEPLEGVYLDAGENGVFSLPEFETLTALGLMEFVTPEEIAQNVLREIQGHPTGRDVVAALDASTMGPTYRAGVLRSAALERMESMEAEMGVQAVAYEMLGPPRLSKLLFEAAILGRLYGTLEAGAALDANDAAIRAQSLLEGDEDLRQRILSIGLPILLPDGDSVLRGALVKVPPAGTGLDEMAVNGGWVDLRVENWTRWKTRLEEVAHTIRTRPGLDQGSQADFEFGDGRGDIRPGRLAAWVFRYEDEGERIKR